MVKLRYYMITMSLKSLGIFIRKRRETLGYHNRPDFEAEFHIAAGSLNNIEGGHSRASTVMIKRLADIIGVRPGLLVDLMFDVISLEEANRLSVGNTSEGESSIDVQNKEQWIKLPDSLEADVIEEIKDFVRFKLTRRQH